MRQKSVTIYKKWHCKLSKLYNTVCVRTMHCICRNSNAYVTAIHRQCTNVGSGRASQNPCLFKHENLLRELMTAIERMYSLVRMHTTVRLVVNNNALLTVAILLK